MLHQLKQHTKNILGWKTHRKIVVFSVDDYGNVRLASSKARKALDNAGFPPVGSFDLYDALETREDLEVLFEALSSVKDIKGRAAIFTPFALPCNIDFERVAEENYSQYYYEPLPQTFSKLEAIDNEAYRGAWNLWQEGIERGLMRPQFHGREHLNIRVFNGYCKAKDKEFLANLKNRSYTGISKNGYKVGQTQAFGFWNFEENYNFKEIIYSGVQLFKEVFGYAPVYFNAPAGHEHNIIYNYLSDVGIKYVDVPIAKKEHQGQGKYKNRFFYTGKKDKKNILYIVRNVVFEPTSGSRDWVNFALQQIDVAFKWKRPAIISSHRVNYCGYASAANRKVGIDQLRRLLKEIKSRWPDVEFMSADELGDQIYNSVE